MLGLSLGSHTTSVNAWDPSHISSIIHWYKFDTNHTLATISETSHVTRWGDMVGSNNLSASDTDDSGDIDTDEAPIYSSGAVRFNQSGDILNLGSAINLGAFSIYVRMSASNFNDMIFEKANGAEFVKLHTNSEFRIQFGSDRKDFTIDPAMSNATVFTFGVERTQGGVVTCWAGSELNDLTQATEAPTVALTNKLYLERMGDPAHDNYFYEIIICNDALSTSERNELAKWLKQYGE